MTTGPVITASTLSAPPQWGHTLMSMSYTRRNRCIQVIAAREAGDLGSSPTLGLRAWGLLSTSQRALTRVGSEDAVIPDQMCKRTWYQCRQTSHEVQRARTGTAWCRHGTGA